MDNSGMAGKGATKLARCHDHPIARRQGWRPCMNPVSTFISCAIRSSTKLARFYDNHRSKSGGGAVVPITCRRRIPADNTGRSVVWLVAVIHVKRRVSSKLSWERRCSRGGVEAWLTSSTRSSPRCSCVRRCWYGATIFGAPDETYMNELVPLWYGM